MRKNAKKSVFFQKKLKKGIDKSIRKCYNISVVESNPREWRNWQTRTFEGRVDNTVRVQVPFLAPSKAAVRLLYLYHNLYADVSGTNFAALSI